MDKQEGSNQEQQDNSPQEQPEVAQELSEVASSPKQGAAILVILGLFFAGLFYFLFFTGGDEEVEKPEIVAPAVVGRPNQADGSSDIPPIPTLPEPPKIEAPTAPEQFTEAPPLPAPEAPPDLPPDLPTEDAELGLPESSTGSANNLPAQPVLPQLEIKSEAAKKRELAKRTSSIMLIQGTPKKSTEQQSIEKNFTKLSSLNYTIRRGKLIDAVIETAINSNFVGEVRAIISRDVFSEQGRNILIPKGSRILGTMKEETKDGYKTIFLTWERVDLPTGYSISFDAINVDGLGRHYTDARIDMKYRETLTNAVMISAFNIAVAEGLDRIVEPQATSEASASRVAEASSIKNAANTIFVGDGTDAEKIASICVTIPNSISDKTSEAFTLIQAACAEVNASDAEPAQQLATLLSSINNAADTLLAVTNQTVEETQAQKASKDAYDSLTKTLSEILTGQDSTPVVSIDQGTKIKVYVNQDYVFPPAAVMKRRGAR